jgi:hypothetical protein
MRRCRWVVELQELTGQTVRTTPTTITTKKAAAEVGEWVALQEVPTKATMMTTPTTMCACARVAAVQ